MNELHSVVARLSLGIKPVELANADENREICRKPLGLLCRDL